MTQIIFLLSSAALEYNVQSTEWGNIGNRYHLRVQKVQPHFGDSRWDTKHPAICTLSETGNSEALFSAGF